MKQTYPGSGAPRNKDTLAGPAGNAREGMPPAFPVQYSTLSPDALRARIIPEYLQDTPARCEYLHRGLNDNYLVTASEAQYVLRVYRHNWRDLRDIESEMELIQYLQTKGVGVSFPVPDRKGKLIQQIDAPEGPRHAVLFSYAEGSSPISKMTVHQSRLAGRELSRMHCTTIRKRLGNNRCLLDTTALLFQSFHAIRPFLPDTEEDLRKLDDVVTKLATKFERVSLSDLSFGICHGDFYPSNYHISEKGKVTLFDFDACCCSWLVTDVAAYCFSIMQAYRNAKELNRAFIEGYREIRPLNALEMELIPYFGAVNRIWVLATQCSNFEVFSHFVRMNLKRNIIRNLKKHVDKYCA